MAQGASSALACLLARLRAWPWAPAVMERQRETFAALFKNRRVPTDDRIIGLGIESYLKASLESTVVRHDAFSSDGFIRVTERCSLTGEEVELPSVIFELRSQEQNLWYLFALCIRTALLGNLALNLTNGDVRDSVGEGSHDVSSDGLGAGRHVSEVRYRQITVWRAPPPYGPHYIACKKGVLGDFRVVSTARDAAQPDAFDRQLQYLVTETQTETLAVNGSTWRLGEMDSGTGV